MLNISKGIVLRPQKVVVYGPEGIGKSTFASHFPDPLFLDIEDSTSQLDVKRIPDINSWAMLMGIIEEVTKEKPCKTLVIDTVDWAEKLCIQYVCAQAKKSSIDELPKIKGDVQFRLLDGASNIMGNKNDSLSDSGVFSALRYSGGKWVGSVALSSKQATDNTDVLHLEFGNNQPHNTLPPSIACYGWRRTA